MYPRPVVLALGALLAAWAPLSLGADEELPKADTLLDRYVEVTGGRAAYEKRRNEVVTLEMEFVGRGIKGKVTRYSDLSNNTYSSGNIEGIGKLEEGVYNGQAWENTAMMGPRLKSGAENADAVRDATFNSALHWRKLYRAETVGVEKVAGEDCYKVQMTPLGPGRPQTMFFSKKSGYTLKIIRDVVSPMGEMKVESVPGDYRTFDGIVQPAKMIQSVMGSQIALTLLSAKSNEEMPKDRMEPPAEIKKMMAK